MMTPLHNAWSVWARPVREPVRLLRTPPEERRRLRAEIAAAIVAGETKGEFDLAFVLSLLDSADQSARPVIDFEATILDDERGVQYAARVNERGDLSRLEVRVEGNWIDDNVMRRVPVARIRREALRHIAELRRLTQHGDDDAFVLSFPGELAERPTIEEVARLMQEGRTRAEIHALYPAVPLPTIGRWMGQVRKGRKAPDAD